MYIKFHEVTWMNIVLLESLGVPDALIAELTAPLLQAGHTFARPHITFIKRRGSVLDCGKNVLMLHGSMADVIERCIIALANHRID